MAFSIHQPAYFAPCEVAWRSGYPISNPDCKGACRIIAAQRESGSKIIPVRFFQRHFTLTYHGMRKLQVIFFLKRAASTRLSIKKLTHLWACSMVSPSSSPTESYFSHYATKSSVFCHSAKKILISFSNLSFLESETCPAWTSSQFSNIHHGHHGYHPFRRKIRCPHPFTKRECFSLCFSSFFLLGVYSYTNKTATV